MSIELVVSDDVQKRVMRIMADTLALSSLTRRQVQAVYGELENARDALSRILDRADSKNA